MMIYHALEVLYLLIKHLEQLLGLFDLNCLFVKKYLHLVQFVSKILNFFILIFAGLRNLAVVIKVIAVSFSEFILQRLKVSGWLKL